jgi:hypothetical protein
MTESLSRARAYAKKIRFCCDAPHVGVELSNNSAEIREKHYQDAIEISSALTPALWQRLKAVCERLHMPAESVSGFIYSSPNVQAECLASGGSQCTVRFSSALLDLLTEEEFDFVVGHEIAHFLLDHQPITTHRLNPESFVQQRSQEISADRLGLLACGSLETAMHAMMKTVSGLTGRHLRFDVAAFISQLRKIEGTTPDWSASTHPSIVIRAKAILWLSLTELLRKEPENWSAEQIAILDQRVERDLQRFVDGTIKKQIDETKSDLLLWMMTYEIVQLGAFPKHLQLRMKELFDSDTVDRLLSFIGGLTRPELDGVVFEKVAATRTQLESLIPQTVESVLGEIRSKIKTELRNRL